MRVVAILCGRFHPFHTGHLSSFQQLAKTFGQDNTFIGFSEKVEEPDSPFSVEDRVKMAMCLGVPRQNILSIKNPYKANEYIQKLKLDANNTALTYAVSDKDMQGDNPRFNFSNPNWLQPYPEDGSNLNPVSNNAYVVTTKTVPFSILNHSVENASDIRNTYPKCDENDKVVMLQELYGNNFKFVKPFFDSKLTSLSESTDTRIKKLIEFIEHSKKLLPTASSEQKLKIKNLVKEAYTKITKENEIVDYIDEATTPPDMYPNKEKLATEQGHEVWWKGKCVGITTGILQNNRVQFLSDESQYGSEPTIQTLPIDIVSIRKKI